MATVSNSMDELKQATVNSLYNVINNSFGTNSTYGNIKCSYDTVNKVISQNDYISDASSYIDSGNYITMANLPYAISWLRNPQKVGVSTTNLAKIPNDVNVLKQDGSVGVGSLSAYTNTSLSLDKAIGTVSLPANGYSRSDLSIALGKAAFPASCIVSENNTYCIKVDNGYACSLKTGIGKLSLNSTATVGVVANDSTKAEVKVTVKGSGYNVANATLTTCIPNKSDKLKTNYCRISLDLNGYVNGWVNAPPNIYNDGNSVFTGVDVNDITWIKDSSGKVCTCTIEGVDDPLYKGCYKGFEVLFDLPEYKDNKPESGIKITHNAARWSNDLRIPEFSTVNNSSNFYLKGGANMLPMGSNKSMTLLRSYFDSDTNSYSYMPTKIPLSAFTDRSYTNAPEITQCPIGGTYTLTPSTSSVTISPGYTGGGTVKFNGCELLFSSDGECESNKWILTVNTTLDCNYRYLFCMHNTTRDSNNVRPDNYTKTLVYLNGTRYQMYNDSYGSDYCISETVYFDVYPLYTSGFHRSSIISLQCIHYIDTYGSKALNLCAYSTYSSFTYEFYRLSK